MKRKCKCGKSARLTAAAAAAAAAVWGASSNPVLAKNWADGTGLWNVNTNWNPAAVPTANEAVNIVFTDGTARTVNYNVTAPSLGLFTVDLTGPGTGASAFSMTSGNNMTAAGVVFGGYSGIAAAVTAGRGAGIQSAGTFTIISGLDFTLGYGAGSVGTYALSGGTIVANQSEYIGINGTGSFTQSAGTNNIATASGFFNIGSAAGSSGTYNFIDGTLLVNTNEAVGYDGTGSFSQSGGTHTISTLYLARDNANSIGNYTMNAGTVSSTFQQYVGYLGTGTFNQSGGTNTVGSSGLFLGNNEGAKGTYLLSGSASLVSTGNEYISFTGAGTFTQTGGSNSVGSAGTPRDLIIGDEGSMPDSIGSYSLGGGVLTVFGNEVMGGLGTGSFTQTGGTHTVGTPASNKHLYLDTDFGAESGAVYTLIDGTLAINGIESLGQNGTATFTQSGGTHTVSGDLTLGEMSHGNGLYTLSGGLLAVAGYEHISTSTSTNNLFVQSGGTHTVASPTTPGALELAEDFGAGSYALSGGSLTVYGVTVVGVFGAATFTQTAGTHTITGGTGVPVGSLGVGLASSSTGTYVLGGSGALIAGQAFIGGGDTQSGGTGIMNLNSGTATVTGVFKIWDTPGTAVNLAGVTLSVGSLDTGGNPSRFHWTAGALNITNSGFNVGPAGPIGGSVTLDAAKTLSVSTGATTIDPFGVLTLNGGTFLTASLINNGTFNFLSGTLGISGASGMTIGSTGALGANVTLGTGQQLNVTNLTTISANGLLVLQNGSLGAIGGVFNNGEVQLNSAISQITGGTFINNKLLLGDGRLVSNLSNSGAGEVRVSSTDRIIFNGATNMNSGKINLINGGTIEFPSSGLSNGGQLQATGGSSDFFGNLTNTSGGKTIVTGNATLSLFNNVTNNAGSEFRVSTGSTAVFFGAVSGSGAFTGGGMKLFEGGPPSLVSAISSVTGDTLVDASVSVSAGVVREDDLAVYGTLTVPPDGTSTATSRVNTLLVASGGKMDLSNNKLIVATGGAGALAGSVYGGVTGLIQSGRNGTSWNGSGLVTTQAAALNSNYTTLGVARASDVRPAAATATQLWGGQVITGTDTLVMYTYGGDATLDGKINIDDYIRIDNGISAHLTGWSNGDFNYDGKVNIDDYTQFIDANIGIQGAPFSTAGGSGAGGVVVAVPEPAAAGILLGVTALGMRRRRRCTM